MRIFKTVLYSIAALFALVILCFFGFFLLRSIPRNDPQPPEVLYTDDLFREDEAVQPEEIPVPEETEEVSDPPEEPLPEKDPVSEDPTPKTLAEDYLQTMTPEEKIWQLFITTPEDITGVNTATRAGDTTKEAVERFPVGGLCYFAKNMEDQAQTVEMLSKTQSYAKTPMFLCVDEEGGSVSRAGSNENLAVTHFPAAAEYGASEDAVAVYDMGSTLAEELKVLGFNVNFAPVADISTDPDNQEIGDRSYSPNPEVAASLVSAMVEGLQNKQMISCLKHFPGHGSAQGDSHEGSCVSNRTVEQLQQNEWLPFQAGIEEGAMFVMISHIINENLSPLPADLSPEVISRLRQELAFSGIIITDSHQMKSITDHYPGGESAVLALQAGVDMVLMPEDPQEAFAAVQAALDSHELTWEQIDQSVLRILTVKYAFGIMGE